MKSIVPAPNPLDCISFVTGLTTKGEKPSKSRKSKKKKSIKKKQAAGEWQGQQDQDTGKNSIRSVSADLADNQDEEITVNPPTLQEVRALLVHQQGTNWTAGPAV